MTEEWCRCPVCFEEYSTMYKPTTFICGHSTCLDHMIGQSCLQQCPLCRFPLNRQNQYCVSYNLLDASIAFQQIRSSVDWPTIRQSLVRNVTNAEDSTSDMIKRDEIYARKLQADLNSSAVRNEVKQRQQAVSRSHRTSTGERSNSNATANVNPVVGPSKQCGHTCELSATLNCCMCSDRRPHRPDNQYEIYVDGCGIVNRTPRNEYYCPTCKRQ